MGNRLRRLFTAFSRYRSGKGFGVHSPFAFNYILKVLEEKCPYYAYTEIESKREKAASMTERHVLTYGAAKRIFRVVNHSNPEKILQIGSDCGVAAVAALSVSSRSEMWLCNTGGDAAAYGILKEYSGRIKFYKSAEDCIGEYASSAGKPFVIVSSFNESEFEGVYNYLSYVAAKECTIVACNLSCDTLMASLWNKVTKSMTFGMIFTNGKLGIIVCDKKLPLSRYSLWF